MKVTSVSFSNFALKSNQRSQFNQLYVSNSQQAFLGAKVTIEPKVKGNVKKFFNSLFKNADVKKAKNEADEGVLITLKVSDKDPNDGRVFVTGKKNGDVVISSEDVKRGSHAEQEAYENTIAQLIKQATKETVNNDAA